METIESIAINKWLSESYPAAYGAAAPLFRIVWSEDMLEKRRGTFLHTYAITMPDGKKVHYRGEHTGVEEVKKYNYLKNCWILEQFAPPELLNQYEIVGVENGGYEPLYVFRDSKFNSLPLNMKVVQIIVSRALAPRISRQARLSADKEEEERRDREEQQYLEDALDLNPLASQLHFGEAVLVPENYEIGEDKE